MRLHTTDLLTEGLKDALSAAGLPAVGDIFWEVPRDERHGDYADQCRDDARPGRAAAPAQGRRGHRRPLPAERRRGAPRDRRPRLRQRVPRARRGVRARSATSWRQGAAYGGAEAGKGERYLLEFVSANPTGPLVIVNARAAAVGDALARILRFRATRSRRSTTSTTPATSSMPSRAHSWCACGRPWAKRWSCRRAATRASTSSTSRRTTSSGSGRRARPRSPARSRERLEAAGRHAVGHMVAGQRRVLADYGTRFDRWSHEAADVRAAGLPRARHRGVAPRRATPTSRTARSGSAPRRSATTRTACCASPMAS